MPNGMMAGGGQPRGAPPGGGMQRGGVPPGMGGANPQQQQALMTLLRMLTQIPEMQVALPVGKLAELVGGGAMRGGGMPQARPMPQMGGGMGARPMGADGGIPRPTPGPAAGGGMGRMQRTAVPPRAGGGQAGGNAQALMRMLGGR